MEETGGYTSTAAINITVTPVNDAPQAIDDVVTTTRESPVTLAVLANDIDVDGDILTVITLTVPHSGAAMLNVDHTVTYTPALGFSGVDGFSYTVADSWGPKVVPGSR